MWSTLSPPFTVAQSALWLWLNNTHSARSLTYGFHSPFCCDSNPKQARRAIIGAQEAGRDEFQIAIHGDEMGR